MQKFNEYLQRQVLGRQHDHPVGDLIVGGVLDKLADLLVRQVLQDLIGC